MRAAAAAATGQRFGHVDTADRSRTGHVAQVTIPNAK